MTSDKLPDSLKEQLAKGNIIPLIGAGVSMSIKTKGGTKAFPSWEELLQNVATALRNEHQEDDGQLVNLLVKRGDYQQAAKVAQEQLTGRLWYDFLDSQFSVDFSQLDESCKSLPRAIWQLSNRVVTLNYEKVLEWANVESVNVCSFDNANTTRLAEFTRGGGQQMLWHLHGKISSPEHMVLTPQSYHRLYEDKAEAHYKQALTKLKELTTNKIILFIGCSLNDAELLAEIAKQDELFKGNTGPHYALVREIDEPDISKKLAGTNVKTISFSDFGQPLIDKVQQLADYKEQTKKELLSEPGDINTPQPVEQIKKYDKITLLTSSPLDQPLDTSAVISKLKNYKYPIYHQSFTENNLRESDDYSILFLIAKKGERGLLIEDNNACGDYLAISELEDNLPINTKLTILITDKPLTDQELETVNHPLIIYTIIGQQGRPLKVLERLTHQLFKKPNTKHLVEKENIYSTNITNELLRDIDLENNKNWICHTPILPREINQSELQGFTGRLSDLASISEKLHRATNQQILLTIKGSGGLGKTTIAKKIALELANRGNFDAGVYFIDCENISSPNQLERHIANAFNLQMADNIFEHLAKHHDHNSRLLILDNFESLLHLKNSDNTKNKFATEQVKKILSQSLLYSTILVTSREIINSEWEEVYPFREMDSEEALSLFNLLTNNFCCSDNNQIFARRKILEPLLNNNPLAIKLICDGIPKGKNLKELKQELEDDFFGKIEDEDLTLMFDDDVDVNINRQESLYASILYSYQTLNDSQRRAFESFSLFPDGIDLGTFKRIIEESKKSDREKEVSKIRRPISDKDIRALSDKSLVENSHDFYKLQSVIHRFSRFQFEQNVVEKDRIPLYRQALRYNIELMDFIYRLDRDNNNSRVANDVYISTFKNFLSALLYGFTEGVLISESDIEEFFVMADGISDFSHSLNLTKDFLSFISKLDIEHLPSTTDSDLIELAWRLIEVYSMYYGGKFDSSYRILKELISEQELMNIAGVNRVGDRLEWIVKGNSQNIYTMEGCALQTLLHKIKFGAYTHTTITSEKVHLGINVKKLFNLCSPNLWYFEAQGYLDGRVALEQIDEAIATLHESEHLDRVSLTYIKSRHTEVELDVVDKLVSVNPYTRGLKSLMHSFYFESQIEEGSCETEISEQIINSYQEALLELKHIKFYYTQAFYYFSRFLRRINHKDYKNIYSQGLKLASQYHYRYWKHMFLLLENSEIGQYDPEAQVLPGDPQVAPLISKQVRWIKQNYGTSLNPFNQDQLVPKSIPL